MSNTAGNIVAAYASLRKIVEVPGLLWLDLSDPMSPALDELAARYGFHELTIEDCRNPIQLPKIDRYDGYWFIVINTTHYTEHPCEVRAREIDVFLGPDYLITIHYGESLAINEIARKVELGALRLARPDMALHAIIDIAVDRYLPTLESIGDTIDKVEDGLLVNPDVRLLETLFALKRGLLQFRRVISYQRELLNALIRDHTELIGEDMKVYFRDSYDHTIRATEIVEAYRDLLSGGLDIYLTQMANRTNEIVKGLTILATLMLPLTLITGYFGMNFEHLPLLKHPHGIWYTTAAMILIGAAMLTWFKHKGWI
jgi:magnesium transporter